MSSENNNMDHTELVKKAQQGCPQSMDTLVSLTRNKILAYMYRLTLDRDLAEDLCQDAMLEMVRSLKQIRDPERFWGWLYRMAMGKVQHYFRQQQRQKAAQSLARERLLSARTGRSKPATESSQQERAPTATMPVATAPAPLEENQVFVRAAYRL